MELSPEATITRSESVMFSEVAQSVVMMDIDQGSYYDLDGPAARIWALLETPRTVSELNALLLEEFEVDPETCRADTDEFLQELARLELVRIS